MSLSQSLTRWHARRLNTIALCVLPLIFFVGLRQQLSWRPQALGESHRSGVFCLAFSPDGATVLVGSPLGAELWDTKTRSLQRRIANTSFGGAGAFSPDGKTIALGYRKDYEWSINLLGTANGALHKSLYVGNLQNASISTLAFSPDGKVIACGTHEQGGYSGSSHHRVHVWDADTGAALWTLDESGYAIFSLAFSPDGASLAVGSTNGVYAGGRVRIVDARTGQLLRELQGHNPMMPCGGALLGTEGTPAPPPIFAVPFDTLPNGRGVTFLSDTVLLTQGDSGIILWDVRTGQVLPSPVLSHSVGSTTVSTSSRDGALLATTNTYLMTPTPSSQIRVSLWNLNTGQLMRHLSSSSGTTNTNLVAISPDSRLLATASTHGGASSGDSTVRLWRLM